MSRPVGQESRGCVRIDRIHRVYDRLRLSRRQGPENIRRIRLLEAIGGRLESSSPRRTLVRILSGLINLGRRRSVAHDFASPVFVYTTSILSPAPLQTAARDPSAAGG